MDKFEVLEYLNEHPEYVNILRLAVEHEEENAGNPHYLGWDWSAVRAYTATINRLIVDGLVKKTYDSANFTNYRLVDPKATKEALRDFEALTMRPTPAPAEEEADVPEDLFSVIEGYDGVKEVIKAGLNSPKPCHCLLVGSVSTAKTLFLEEVDRVKGSSYHVGSSSTKAGLTQFLLDRRPRILLIDEFDKMNRDDYACLLSVMESGKVVETKYGRRHEEHMKVWVLASCNSLKGVPPENVSRFRPYIFHFREYTSEEYVRVVVRVLTEREGVDPDLARYIASKLVGLTRDVRAARGLGRACKTKEDVDRHVEILKRYEGFKYA
jgi:Holliday junction DNA helicase RuvB